jgi:hypothetical protein
MTNSLLPWNQMPHSSRRRVSNIHNHQVFWITDIDGHFGFYIEILQELDSTETSVKLQGINFIKRNSESGHGELILLLNNKEDGPIFYKICEDLILTIKQNERPETMISLVEQRLQRWQELLKKGNTNGLSVELQMGLFSELIFIKDYLSKAIGIEQSIVSWVGPEFDKQDFLLDKSIVEIKSYRTSKGQLVNISSLQQLHSEKHPLFLVAFGLTRSENGSTIKNVVDEILLSSQLSSQAIDMFNLKLVDYGYIPEFQNEPFASFILDNARFYSVKEDFPRIPLSIAVEIIKVSYTIDLSKCNAYEVTFNQLISS